MLVGSSTIIESSNNRELLENTIVEILKTPLHQEDLVDYLLSSVGEFYPLGLEDLRDIHLAVNKLLQDKRINLTAIPTRAGSIKLEFKLFSC